MNTNLDISVIIPAYNAAASIGACIESVLAQQTRERYELLVVDDGSTDCTGEVAARYPRVRVLRQANTGVGGARNLGAREARGWILCFIDADCVATSGWLDALVGAIRDGADGVKGTLLTNQPEPVARFTQIEYEDKYDRMAVRSRIDFIDMGSAAYRRDVMLELGEGGFDTSFPGASVEDQEFSYRLAKLGCDLRFVAGATVYHRHPTTLRSYIRRKFNIGRWKVLVHVRHPERMISDSQTPPSQKAQLLLLGGIGFSVAAAPLKPEALALCAPLVAGFLLSSLPFISKAAHKDLQIAAFSPFMLLVRAASLAAGLLSGLLMLLSGVAGRGSGISVHRQTPTAPRSRSYPRPPTPGSP